MMRLLDSTAQQGRAVIDRHERGVGHVVQTTSRTHRRAQFRDPLLLIAQHGDLLLDRLRDIAKGGCAKLTPQSVGR